MRNAGTCPQPSILSSVSVSVSVSISLLSIVVLLLLVSIHLLTCAGLDADEERQRRRKEIVSSIPTSKDELFAYAIDWSMATDDVIKEVRALPFGIACTHMRMQ